MREKRKKLKQLGLCDACRERKRREGGFYCEECLHKDAQKRKTRKENGLCIICGVPSTDRSRCESCVIKERKNDLALRRKRKNAGLCVRCASSDVESPHIKCNSCLTQQAKKWHEKIARLTSMGLCVKCESQELVSGRLCSKCYLESVASKRLGNKTRWQELSNLFFEQGGKCPYTGTQLEIGKNTELDHKVPVFCGGSHDIRNLQWVYAPINTMKWKWNEEVFLSLVKMVYRYRESMC